MNEGQIELIGISKDIGAIIGAEAVPVMVSKLKRLTPQQEQH
jgi:hypothetical protein